MISRSTAEVTLDALSSALGWGYFLSWSSSFYPQFWINWRRKRVDGMSIDFVLMNCEGMLFLSIYTCSFYWNEEIRRQYRDRNDGQDNLVTLSDVVFALHATCELEGSASRKFLDSTIFQLSLVFFFLLQCFLYDGSRRRPHLLVLAFLLLSTVPAVGLSLATIAKAFPALDLLYYLSYVKLATVVVKYVPQAVLNWQRQSTIGWSIESVLLDISGGILSFGQLGVDTIRTGTGWSGILGDPVKLFLCFLSIFFDVTFMIQHYVLYRQSQKLGDEDVSVTNEENNPALLPDSVEEEAPHETSRLLQ
ncbi:PQ-loop-domain-containing protein [Gonapodya prolifera JEL478]|uniref:PQ-loop-domain-containing protein n=1 Tax=Gonapodya prolifera (strain JEL478) TaxID=1344416 RepID=A0A139AGU2_GONPJ|nr:PQ-loop-domain-containing protein [Gonapodya prolifera JEL478]|eukprot:KXS15665.1 PQ-loop-domain-containing protein [Gonapodya prolifera JEL478]